jgi:hypothetical protein
MQGAFRQLKNLNLQTELLEAFDWDQEELDEFNEWLIGCLNVSSTPTELRVAVGDKWGLHIVTIVDKIIGSEISNLRDDAIQETVYED